MDILVAMETQGLADNEENVSRVIAQMKAKMEEETPRTTPDATPGHYQYPIQPKQYAQANGLDFAQGNVVKYVTRYKAKEGVRDLLKAVDYLLDLAEYEQLGEATTLPRVERLKMVLDREEGKC